MLVGQLPNKQRQRQVGQLFTIIQSASATLSVSLSIFDRQANSEETHPRLKSMSLHGDVRQEYVICWQESVLQQALISGP